MRDSSQAVVAGATVTLTNVESGVSNTQKSNDVGSYLFDFILPGTYSVSVELQGFRKFQQNNILVQARGDVTVNATLEVGATGEAITIEASPVSVQFNTSTVSLTVDRKMANDLPVINRNPFLLAQLNPATVVRSTTEQSPFHHWAATQIDVGGNTTTKNDVILDGASSMASEKSSYTPAMDAVSEVNVQQNAVDAEYGFSAGGIISVQMKSGTNAFHGTGYYLGRNPAINAVADHITRRANLTRSNVLGGTLGNPILKNRLFNFASYEMWRMNNPLSIANTMPTAAERTGDFSASRNASGGLRTIYDPFSTRSVNGAFVRTPFPGNRIPTQNQDPVGQQIMKDIWEANNPGDDITGANNFRNSYAENIRYWNFSDRVDWNVNDKLKVFGRFSMFKTFVEQASYTNGARAQQPNGSERHSWNSVGDVVYTLNASTVLNVRGSYNKIFDSFAVQSAQIGEAGLATIWPSKWYQSYLSDAPAIYYPGVTVRQGPSATVLGRTGFWYQDPDTYTMSAKVTRNQGKHYFKVGGDYRKQSVVANRPRPMQFDLRPDFTAAEVNAPNTRVSGDAWASLLVGAIDQNSLIASIPLQRPNTSLYSLFFHDDYKITSRLTLNLGLRWEYSSAMTDPQDRLSRYLDLTSPIPELQGANAPVMPAAVSALRTAAPIYNGAWIFTDSSNRNSWNAQRNLFMPRAGFAYRLDNNTALRFGYARYLVPAYVTDGLDILGSVQYPGFDAQTNSLPFIAGVPQARLSNPFPAGLVPVSGKTYGRYTNLGAGANWYNQDFGVGVNDRINVTVERQLPMSLLLNATYFANIGRSSPYTLDMNQVDPRIGFAAGTATQASVANPFFNKLSADKMPGTLRTQQNVQANVLLRPYPQYNGSLNQLLTDGIRSRYQAIQLQLQRPFLNGFNLVLGYNYNRAKDQVFYDNVDQYLNNFTWQTSANPRQRITGAAIYQIPVGKGRKYGANANRFVDGIIGGWALSSIFTFNTGEFLRFGGLLVDGDPSLDNPTKDRMFDTSKFRVLPAFTRRTNPWQYDGVKGMNYKNLDMTLNKQFDITERVKFELRMEAYNALNGFIGANPITDVNSGQFGRITSQRGGYFGRQFQYSGRFIF
ncbi:MAG: TonB-dependent receptor [Bryobacterales bacterium]|nr:TonB-dependent receptor [Bryobacterales bacterium]